jgi:hypothetical protein
MTTVYGIAGMAAHLGASPAAVRKWLAEDPPAIPPPDVRSPRFVWHDATGIVKPDPSRNRRPRPPATECHHGHDLTGRNLYVSPLGKRSCRICQGEAKKRWRAKKAGQA